MGVSKGMGSDVWARCEDPVFFPLPLTWARCEAPSSPIPLQARYRPRTDPAVLMPAANRRAPRAWGGGGGGGT